MTSPDALLYAGRINALNGESGSGKSWVAMQTAAEVMSDGGHVIYVDLEDHAGSVVARFRDLGLPDPVIVQHLHYINPDRALTEDSAAYVDRLITEHAVELVVIDSIGELMSLQGVKDDDQEVAAMYRAIPRRWANLGPCILVLHHVPKSNDRNPLYGIGSQRHRAAIDGAAYMVEQIAPFATGRSGQMRLVTAKDRNGWYPTGSTAAIIDVEAGDRLTLTIRAPGKREDVVKTGSRPDSIMAAVTAWLYRQPQRTAHLYAMRQAKLCSSSATLAIALETLATEGYIAKEATVRRGKESVDYVWVRAYRPDDEPVDNSPDQRPDHLTNDLTMT